ncbi:MAG: glycosyltransferase family 39 protein [Candidatus Binatia bacterium]
MGVWVVAVALRLGFVLHLPHLPFYWDEKYYDFHAKTYAAAWQSLATPAAFAASLEAAFNSSLQKGEAYDAFAGAVYALAGPKRRAVFVAQALVDAVTCLLVYGIAKVLAGPAAGLVALALAAVYPPSIFAVGRFQSETWAAFLCAGALWAFVCPWRHREWLGPAGSGLLLALAMLTRPAFQFLFPLWLPLAALVPREASRRQRVTRCAAFAAGFFALIGPRLVATTLLVGHPLWSGTLDPSNKTYSGIVYENLGWQTDHLEGDRLGELPEVLRERGHRQPDMDDYRLATARTWERHPLESAAVLLHKTYVVWRHPYNDSLRTFVLSARGQRRVHQAVLVLAALGLPLALQSWRVGVPLVVTILYMWATYFAVQIELRYMVTAIPLMICCAGVAVVRLGRGVGACRRANRLRAPAMLSGLMVISLVLLQAASLGRLAAAPFQLSAMQAYTLHRVLTVLVLVEGAALAFALLAAGVPLAGMVSRRWAVATAALPCLGGALIFLVGGTLANLWHQWTCPLTAGDAVREDLAFPTALPLPARAEVRLDLAGYSAGQQDFVVMIDGVEAARFTGGPTLDNAVASEETAYAEIFAGQGRQPRPWHGWYAVALAPQLLAGAQRLRVEARVEGGGSVVVFGDYPLDSAAIYDGPSPVSPELNVDTSVYKYLADGDFRLRRRYPLSGKSWSSYFDGHQWRTDDLSPLPGRQYGRYRIMLRLVYPNGQVLIF